jgi:hypothetical protein
MGWFQRESPSNFDIEGFWDRAEGAVLQGKFVKHIPNAKNPKQPKPFCVFKITADTGASINVEGEKKPIKAVVGQYVGVSASWSLKSQLDMVNDIGKEVRLTGLGTADNPNGKIPMTLLKVEVNEPDDTNTPF